MRCRRSLARLRREIREARRLGVSSVSRGATRSSGCPASSSELSTPSAHGASQRALSPCRPAGRRPEDKTTFHIQKPITRVLVYYPAYRKKKRNSYYSVRRKGCAARTRQTASATCVDPCEDVIIYAGRLPSYHWKTPKFRIIVRPLRPIVPPVCTAVTDTPSWDCSKVRKECSAEEEQRTKPQASICTVVR